jgi:superfamily II DNA or RNA helicase
MFCGSGKSRIMHNLVKHYNLQLSVFVFPSLSLIDQFHIDYLKDTPHVLKISSDKDSTTNAEIIIKFIKKKTHKIICITYQSFELLLDNLQDNKIDICCFDEAHHAVGNTYQKLIFNDDNLISKQVFFTATPKNANGIVMYDRNDLNKSMCGNLVYDYSYLQGVDEGFLNPFEIRCDLYTENTNKSIYESIARAVLTTGNNRVLTFHSNVNSDTDTSVSNFVNESTFKDVFKEVVNSEFPDKKGFYKKISMIGLDATTVMTERRKILKKFKKCEEDTTHEIVILSSCETIGEGVDTNDANMCVFVDPKSSIVKIIQNIGRIVRKQFGVDKANSTILIPCWVDKDKYAVCNGIKEECDKVIREDMSAGGNFSGILNVMSALQQEQPDVYDLCMNYPDTYTYQEIESNFTKQGYKIDDVVGEGTLQETIEHIIDKEIEGESIDDISKNENVCIEVYTDLIDEPLIKYNENCDGDVVRMYKGEDDTYQPIVKNDGNKKCCKMDKLNAVVKQKRINVNFHSNGDVKVLWNIDNWNCDMNSGIKSCLLKCEVLDVWNTNFDKLKEFIDTNKRRPAESSKNKDEKILGIWLRTQNRNYSTRGMKNDCRRDEWCKFLEQYNEYMDVWNTKIDKLKTFIDTNKRRPAESSKNKDEKLLGSWLGIQRQHHKNRGMINYERRDVWVNFMEQYNEYFVSINDMWNTNLDKLKEFIDTNKKTPSHGSKNKDEKFLGSWLHEQKKKFINMKHEMINDERYDVWVNFMEQYNEYFSSNDIVWVSNFQNLKEFMYINKRSPSVKYENEKKLAYWTSHQHQNYKNKKGFMNDDALVLLWMSFRDEQLKKVIASPVKTMELVSATKVKEKTQETQETPENRRIRTKTQMEILHQRYKTLSSVNLNKEFSDNSNLWNEYHEISEKNEESFPVNEIPRNKIIQELDKQVIKRKRTVVDMGCGKGQISKYFTDKNDKRFQFINYDHVSSNDRVISCDISNIPLEDGSVDMVILSLSMWGSNCKSYIAEANRILDLDGKLYIIEATKRWSEKDENHNLIQGEEGGKLKRLLVENNFQILESEIKKFSMFTCVKIN